MQTGKNQPCVSLESVGYSSSFARILLNSFFSTEMGDIFCLYCIIIPISLISLKNLRICKYHSCRIFYFWLVSNLRLRTVLYNSLISTRTMLWALPLLSSVTRTKQMDILSCITAFTHRALIGICTGPVLSKFQQQNRDSIFNFVRKNYHGNKMNYESNLTDWWCYSKERMTWKAEIKFMPF